jgi:tetratricopeptide (TPR) repeat protein
MKANKKEKRRKAETSASGLNPVSPFVILPALAAVTWAVFSRCTDFEVTNWDDNHYIRELLLIRSLAWDNILLIFKTKVLLSYNPLVIVSLAVDYALGGNSPGWYHGMNVLLHAANSLLVFTVLRKLGTGAAVAALSAFLFALHPMHVESVAWIASRKDVLYTFFFLLSWWSYLQYRELPGTSGVRRYVFYGLSLLLFLASGFSKIQAVTLPLVLLLSDYFKAYPFDRRGWLEKLPFFAGAAAFGWYAVSSSTLKADQYAEPVTFLSRIIYSFQAYWQYVVKSVLPINQTAIYAFPLKDSSEYMIWLVGGIVLALLTIVGVLYFLKRNVLACFGLLFFAVNIFPTLHVVGLNSSLIYERFTYVSYIGIFLFLAALPASFIPLRRTLPLILWLAVVPFAVIAYQRTEVWKNSLTLWSDVVEKNPRSHEALNNRGAWYNEHGQSDMALGDFNTSLVLNPRQPRTLNNRSMVWFQRKEYDRALQDADSALSMEPKLAEAWCNRGNVFFDRTQYDSAIVNYSNALKYMPNFPSNYTNRGSAYLKKGDFEKAKEDYESAIRQSPNDGGAWRLCALAYAELGEHEKAYSSMQRALELGQGDAAAMLSSEYIQIGRRYFARANAPSDSAFASYDRAAKVDPRNYEAWFNIGGMYYLRKDIPKARENWKKALQVLPTYAEAKLWLERTGGLE